MCEAVQGYRDRDFLLLMAGTLVEVRALMQSRIVSVLWIKCKIRLVVVMARAVVTDGVGLFVRCNGAVEMQLGTVQLAIILPGADVQWFSYCWWLWFHLWNAEELWC